MESAWNVLLTKLVRPSNLTKFKSETSGSTPLLYFSFESLQVLWKWNQRGDWNYTSWSVHFINKQLCQLSQLSEATIEANLPVKYRALLSVSAIRLNRPMKAPAARESTKSAMSRHASNIMYNLQIQLSYN